jgi:hypothetical protein
MIGGSTILGGTANFAVITAAIRTERPPTMNNRALGWRR